MAEPFRAAVDGGSRGNPGPAAWAVAVLDATGAYVEGHAGYLGPATNNVAEYSGLIAGLRKAVELQLPSVEVVSDSELMVKQMLGEYKVKNAALLDLSLAAKRLAAKVGRVEYRHVFREQNELADRLVNEALDAASA